MELYESGEARCGDLVVVWFSDVNELLVAPALDTGAFGDNCVVEGDGCVPIAVDVPRHLWPAELGDTLSARVQVMNVTAQCRAWGICE